VSDDTVRRLRQSEPTPDLLGMSRASDLSQARRERCPRTIAVFAGCWGAPSEVFVRRQVAAMTRFRAFPISISLWRGACAEVQGVYALQHRHPFWHLLCRLALSDRAPGHRPLYWVPAWVPLAKACRRAGVQIVHAHFGPAGLMAVPLARALRVPLVVTFHGYDVTSFPLSSGYRQDYPRVLFHAASALIAVSEFVRGRLNELGAPAEKLVTHYIGVPVEPFSPTMHRRSRVSPLRLVSVGRLFEGKGQDILLRAVSLLNGTGMEVSLTLVGDGGTRPRLEALARELRITRLVHFAGWQPPDAVAEMMRDAHVFVMPSVSTGDGWVEGMGLAHLEAAASGLPVVASRSGGIPEGVLDGVTGFLVDEKDSEGLAQRISVLASDPHLRRRMGIAGRAMVEDRFNLAKQTARLEDLYHRVLADSQAQRWRAQERS